MFWNPFLKTPLSFFAMMNTRRHCLLERVMLRDQISYQWSSGEVVEFSSSTSSMMELTSSRVWIRCLSSLPIYWSGHPGDDLLGNVEKALLPSSMHFICDDSRKGNKLVNYHI